jgi:hypothetical protein
VSDRRRRGLVPTLALVPLVIVAAVPSAARAQAFTPPQGVGAVTLAWQYVDNTGHRLSDGYFRKAGESVTTSGAIDVDFGVTDRLSVSAGIPYVFAKYTGALPPPSGLPVDACACWHSGFSDFSLGARYRFGDEAWAVTPLVRYGQPSHAYPYRGEAVVGKQLTEAQIGVAAAVRLERFLPRANLQAGYTYSFVEKALDEITVDRSNGYVEVGYSVGQRWYFRGNGVFQHTHGGLRIGSLTGNPFPLPGEYNTPERRQERDRLGKVHYWQAGGGVAYSTGPVDLFASYSKYIWGRDAHNGHVYGLGATWYFDLRQ